MIMSLYGNSGESLTEVSNKLIEMGIDFRVCLTNDLLETPILRSPFGDFVGLNRICSFVSEIKSLDKE